VRERRQVPELRIFAEAEDEDTAKEYIRTFRDFLGLY
jgi:hypothetical protein